VAGFVGVQVGAVSLVDEGVKPVLDLLQEKAGISAVFLATQAFDRGVGGRPMASLPWSGHGHRDVDDHQGGSYVTQHRQFYEGTVLEPYRAPDAEVVGFDVLDAVIPEARARDIKVYSFVLENTHSGLTRSVPNWPKVLQVDAWGRTDNYACLRNPDYVNWWLSVVEDQIKSYPFEGLMFGSERNGPLANTIGGGGLARNANPYCFCGYCVAAGEQRGIDARRAREAYLALFHLTQDDTDEPDSDSSFIRFLRLLLTYPEIMAWDQLWYDGYQDLQKRIYGVTKFLAPEVQVGWHVWHHNSFSPLLRAQINFADIAEYSDFVKPVLYNSCAGYRLHDHVQRVGRSIFRGVADQTIFDLYRAVLGYDEDVAFEDLPRLGLSPDYVLRETRRTVRAVGGRAKVYPGLDINVASPAYAKKAAPEDVRASVRAALEGGADGIVLSRKYAEMTWANLEAVGSALRESGSP
jgi:hypothetical protein